MTEELCPASDAPEDPPLPPAESEPMAEGAGLLRPIAASAVRLALSLRILAASSCWI